MNQYIQETLRTASLSVPFIINQLLYISVVTVDNLMAGSDSELTLAAVAQGSALWNVVTLMLVGLMMVLSPMIARVYTRHHHEQMRELFQQCIWLGLITSILALPILLLSPYLMVLIGVKQAIVSDATDYLYVMAFALPFFGLYLPVRFFNDGIGNPKVIMFITAITIPINATGNYILLNGLLGLPKMGATGIAISSVISMFTSVFFAWLYMLKSQHISQFKLFSHWYLPTADYIKRFCRLGIPNAIALVMEVGMFALVTLLSGRLGVTEAAANQIALNYTSITYMIPLGLSMAIMTRVGMAMGKDNLLQARVIGISGTVLGAVFMLLSTLIILFLGTSIASLYTDNVEVITLTVSLFILAAIFQIPDAIQACSAGALRGLEDTQSPMRYAIIGYWVIAVPLAIILAFYTHLSASGLWIGLLIGLSATAILCSRKFLQCTQPIK